MNLLKIITEGVIDVASNTGKGLISTTIKKALDGSASSGDLLDRLDAKVDVIRCDEKDYLIWKWQPQNGSAKKYNHANAIRTGSLLHVRDGSAAVFVYTSDTSDYGQDYFIGPYDEILETNNLPILSKYIGKIWDGSSPFQAEVYFINMAKLIQLPFGIPYFDLYDPHFPDCPVPTAVRGVLNFNIDDILRFIELHRLDEFNIEDFNNQIRATLIMHAKKTILDAPYKYNISILQLERKIEELSDSLFHQIKDRFQNDFGIIVTRLTLSVIDMDKNSNAYCKLMSML